MINGKIIDVEEKLNQRLFLEEQNYSMEKNYDGYQYFFFIEYHPDGVRIVVDDVNIGKTFKLNKGVYHYNMRGHLFIIYIDKEVYVSCG